MNKTFENNETDINYKNFNLINNIPNDNLINMANNIDMLTIDDINQLNGTNVDSLNNETARLNIPINRSYNRDDNKSLIKTLTKEILENLNDNSDYDSKYALEEFVSDKNNKSKPIKSHKPNKSKKEHFDVVENKQNYYNMIFDSCFGIKEYILLFGIYFILSQEMIKDFFSKYFTSLNEDMEGKVNVQGVIVYGLILTTLFMLTRKFV